MQSTTLNVKLGKLKALADVRKMYPRMTEQQIRKHFPELTDFLDIDTTEEAAYDEFAPI